MNLARTLFVLALALSVAGCASWPRSARYRFTVEVEDNGRIVSGSAVQEERCAFNDGLIRMEEAGYWCGVKGEAVVVDLGEKGLLFVLLTADPGRPRVSYPPFELFGHAHHNQSDQEGLTPVKAFDLVAASRDTVTLDAVHTPMMVRFRDIDDPKSVELVDPEHLDASFGAGVRFLKATVAITSDAVTTGIEKRAPWVSNLQGSIGKDLHLPYDNLLNVINDGSFRQGLRQ